METVGFFVFDIFTVEMTRNQLKNLYAFVQLPYSEDSEALSDLKKILLLELKPSNSEVLVIQEKHWSKNDIILFFDTPIEDRFDYNKFLFDYPWVSKLETPELIMYEKNLLDIDFSDIRFSEFAKTESKDLEEHFFRTYKNYIIARQDYYAVALLLYEKCFTTTFQSKLYSEARVLLENRFKEMIALRNETQATKKELTQRSSYLKSEGFYLLMKKTANEDDDLLFLNVEALHSVIDLYAISSIRNIVNEQLKLNHGPIAVMYLNKAKEQVQKRVVEQERQAEQTANGSNVYAIIGLILLVLRLILYLSN